MRLSLKIAVVFLILALGLALFITAIFKNKEAGRAFNKEATMSESFRSLYSLANEQESQGQLLDAKKTYEKILADFSNNPNIAEVQKELEKLNMKIIFSGTIDSHSKSYEVSPEDTLDKIAKQFNTTVDLLRRANSLPSDVIQAGRRIKVYTGRFSCLIDKSQNTLTLKVDDEIIKVYSVSTGKDNSTPIGTFKIVNKLTNPVWYKAGAVVPPESPENILGSRWLGLSVTGYGIHGTTEPETIGRQITSGCVRMLNSEVEELYILLPIGTEVTIVD